MLKFACKSKLILNIYYNIINSIHHLNHIPEFWRISKTILIPKNDKSKTLNDLRPICLQSCELKIYTYIINKKIMEILIKYHLIPQEQNGFIPNLSTNICISTLIKTIQNSIDKEKEIHITYIDFVKAFDSIEWFVILNTMTHMGFGPLVNTVKSILSRTCTQIHTSFGITNPIYSTRGIIQGDPLSPTLFIIAIAPLLWKIKKCTKGYSFPNKQKITSLAYADDLCTISSKSKDANKQFNIILKFCKVTGMQINPSKSAYAASNFTSLYLPHTNGTLIPFIGKFEHYKYLGLWISLNLDWQKQMKESHDLFTSHLQLLKSKSYLPIPYIIKWINMVALTPLAYRFNFVIFPYHWLNQIKTLTTDLLNSISKIPSISDYYFWILIRNLKDIFTLNIERYISNQQRILNSNNIFSFIFKNEIHNQLISLDKRRTFKPIYYQLNYQIPSLSDLLSSLLLRIYNNSQNPIDSPFLYSAPSPSLSHISNTITVFTDGSVIKDRNNHTFCRSAFLTEENNFSFNFSPIGNPSSIETELQAIEATIQTFINTENIRIITDSLFSINYINESSKWKSTNWLSFPYRPTLRRILHLIDLRKSKNLSPPQLIYIPSHSTERNNNNNKETFNNLSK